MLQVRASKRPLFKACASSVYDDGQPPFNPPTAAADSGRAVHDVLYSRLTGDDVDVHSIAAAYKTDPDEVGILAAYGMQAWDALKQYFPMPHFEHPLDSPLTGPCRADVVSVDPVNMAVLDWKSGRIQRDYIEQLKGYAYALFSTYGMPECGYIDAIVVWLRSKTYDVHRITAAEILGMRTEHERHVLRIGKDYNPGQHCEHCPRQLRCTALHEYQYESVQIMTREMTLDKRNVVALYPRVQLLEKAIERYRDVVRFIVSQGPLDCGEGRELALVDVEKDVIDAAKAWPLLLALGISNEDITKVVRFGKGDLSEVIGKYAEGRTKGRTIKDTFAKLEAAGAVTKTSYQKLEMRKKQGETP